MMQRDKQASQAVSGRILTIPNLITMLRLALIPVAYSMLVSGTQDFMAFIVFAVAASTDWVDGQVARATNTVTRLGQELDPLVDRLLIAAGVIGLHAVDRLPLWLMVILVVRDATMMAGSARLRLAGADPIPVMFLGKVTTALLMVAFSGLILGLPVIDGFGLIDTSWLPGFSTEQYVPWIWLIYIALPFSIATAVRYTTRGAAILRAQRMSSG